MLKEKSLSKMTLNCGVYQILNKDNGHSYIGSSIDLLKRFDVHKRSLKRQDHHSIVLQRAWNKYSEDVFKFSILLYCDKKDCIVYEQAVLDKFLPEYNISQTAGSPLGVIRSEETKQKLRILNLGKKLSLETRKKMGLSQAGNTNGKGYKHTAKAIEKIRLAGIGRKVSEETREKMRISAVCRKMKPQTDDHKRKISKALTGRKQSEEHIENNSKARIGVKHSKERKMKIGIGVSNYYKNRKAVVWSK